jgi:adenylate cyclase
MKGWAAFFLGDRTLENFRVAEPCYREALSIDPNHPDSLIGLGAVIAGRLFNFGVYDLSHEQLRKEIGDADALLDRGLAAKPNSAPAHAAKGILLACQQRWREALPHISAAHSLDPSSALFALNLGNTLSSLGRVVEALPYFREAIRRSPRDPSMGLLQLSLGRAHLLLGQWEEALEACLNARAKVPSMFLVHVTLAAALAKMGQIEAARSSVADAIQTEPKLSLSWLKSHTYSTDSAYVRLAEQTLHDGLRIAGLRETVDHQHGNDRSPDAPQSTQQT